MGWAQDALRVAELAVARTLRPRSVTSREGNPDLRIDTLTVNGIVLRSELPWVHALYAGLFREFGQSCAGEALACADNDLFGAVLGVQRGSKMRYEAHVDSNPLEGLLYVTSHPSGAGGELIVANDCNAKSVAEIEADCSTVFPMAGHLLFFDARRFPHYVRPLVDPNGTRVVVAMNYYTASCPESSRPADLTSHLFGEQTLAGQE